MKGEVQCFWQEQIQKTKEDPSLSEEDKKRIISSYELFIWQDNYLAEKKARAFARRRARSLAKHILRKTEEIKAMQKELGNIFYFDGHNRSFSHSERSCDPNNEQIRKALKVSL